MLTYADSSWHILSAVIVFFLGLLLILFQGRVFQVPQRRALLFYCWHTFFCLCYLNYSLSNTADATLYYLESIHYNGVFNVGTKGIICLTSLFSNTLSMSYGGVFLVYNLFGFIGMLSLASALQQVTVNSTQRVKQTALFLLLTPGLSFWSSAIGKDSLSFMAVGLVCWASLRIKYRYPAIILGCITLLFVRPHVFCVMLGSFVVAIVLASRLDLLKKTVILTAFIPLVVSGAIFTAEYVGLGNASGLEDVQEFIDSRQSHNLGGGTSIDIASMSLPLRMFSYLYRPFFLENSSLFGLVLGVENLFLLVTTGYLIWVTFVGRRSQLDRFSMWFFLTYSFFLWFVFANTTANLGIAIRQKWMFLPMIFLITFSLTVQKQVGQNLKKEPILL